MQSAHENDTPPAKRCRGCGYVLDYLPETRCPECGRQFDSNNARTFDIPSGTHPKAAIVVTMYLLPFMLNAAVWVRFEMTWPGYTDGVPPGAVLRTVMLAESGPLASLLSSCDTPIIVCTSGVLWVLWPTVVCRTRVRRLPYWLHFGLSVGWCLWGFVFLGIDV